MKKMSKGKKLVTLAIVLIITLVRDTYVNKCWQRNV